MLKGENRLKKKSDFDAVLRGKKRFGAKALYLKTGPNHADSSRIGFMLSKKVSKSAAARNRIRRIIREEVRGRISEMRQGGDIVFVGLPGLEKLSAEEIRNMVLKLLKEASIL